MKRFLKRIFIFSICALLIYPLALLAWIHRAPSTLKPAYMNDGNYWRFIEANEANNIDVLVLGPSTAAMGFDPRIFREKGIRIFNLGSDDQTPRQTLALVKKYLDSLSPKIVVYDIVPRTLITEKTESTLSLMANGNIYPNPRKELIEERNTVVLNAFLYSLIRPVLAPRDSSFNPIKSRDKKYIPGGYIENQAEFSLIEAPADAKLEWNEGLMDCFEQIVEMIKERDIPLILTHSPALPAFYQTQSSYESFDSMMQTYASYYDFNKLIHLDTSGFADFRHLNQRGVNIYNRAFIKETEIDQLLIK